MPLRRMPRLYDNGLDFVKAINCRYACRFDSMTASVGWTLQLRADDHVIFRELVQFRKRKQPADIDFAQTRTGLR